jgi:hypothetical protein
MLLQYNIFLEDPNYDDEVLFNMDNDNNNEVGDQGHGGGNGDSSNGEGEYPRQYSLINCGNVYHKKSFDKIKVKVEEVNGIYSHADVGST